MNTGTDELGALWAELIGAEKSATRRRLLIHESGHTAGELLGQRVERIDVRGEYRANGPVLLAGFHPPPDAGAGMVTFLTKPPSPLAGLTMVCLGTAAE